MRPMRRPKGVESVVVEWAVDGPALLLTSATAFALARLCFGRGGGSGIRGRSGVGGGDALGGDDGGGDGIGGCRGVLMIEKRRERGKKGIGGEEGGGGKGGDGSCGGAGWLGGGNGGGRGGVGGGGLAVSPPQNMQPLHAQCVQCSERSSHHDTQVIILASWRCSIGTGRVVAALEVPVAVEVRVAMAVVGAVAARRAMATAKTGRVVDAAAAFAAVVGLVVARAARVDNLVSVMAAALVTRAATIYPVFALTADQSHYHEPP